VAIDLDCTIDIVKTFYSSLILNKRFNSKIFLKGLLLKGQLEGKKFKYSYNILYRTIGQDRKTL
jgi:hypothetical protein